MIVGILGPGGCGGTFLDWSIQFLSGATKNWVVECNLNDQRSSIATEYEQHVLFDPMKNSSAHNHYKTHPNHNSVPLVIDSFRNKPQYNLHSFYYSDVVHIPTPSYASVVAPHSDVKFIVFNFSPTDFNTVFYLQYEKIPLVVTKLLKIIEDQNSKLPIWGQREILSLAYPRIIRPQIKDTVPEAPNATTISFKDMLLSLDVKIFEIFNFLELSIDKQRLDHWNIVYKNWQQKNYVNFYADLDKIINCVIDNHSLSLDEYGMSFAKETVITSILLHQHNLALKMDGLETMPNNTTEWHKLLEPNIYHNLIQ